MKITDIENNPYVEKRDWIGQGWGYKADWKTSELDDVVYIPEYGYETDDKGMYIESPYTKQDFLDLCDGVESVAIDLFDGVDWQFPETLIDEGYLDDEEDITDISPEDLREWCNSAAGIDNN